MEGRIDELNRPVLRVEVNDRPLRCLVDTGFNGFLWIDERVAQLIGVYQKGKVYESELADGRPAEFKIAVGSILWFDQPKNIPIHVFQGERHSNLDGILGTRLLIGYVLIADFNWGLVSVRFPGDDRDDSKAT